MDHRQRTIYSLAAIFGLLLFICQVSSALAQNYTITSLFSVNAALPQLPYIEPSINNLGEVVYVTQVFDPVQNRWEWVVIVHDGTTETPFFNLDDAGSYPQSTAVINDNGAVALMVGGGVCPNNVLRCAVRINPNQTVTVLATENNPGGGGDVGNFQCCGLSMNNSGQVAALVARESDGANQIIRIDGPGQLTVIFTQTASLINPTAPSINNSGVVAFTASDISCQPTFCTKVFSGTGGVLTEEGVSPSGCTGFAPFINNNGLVLASGCGPALIYTAQGGVVNTLVVGNEDPVFTSLGTQPSQNDLGQFVFESGICNPCDFGLFTGNDPSRHTVVRSNQTVFGGTISEFRTALHYINNSGQIVFAMTEVDGSGNPTTYIVRADPIVDTTPPETSITSSPGSPTSSTNATFSFTSGEGSTFECSLDGAAFTACTNPKSYSSLAGGSHTFQVRAIDTAGNTDPTPASFTWTIDLTAPETTITDNPPPSVNSTAASFSFMSNEGGSTFECSLDGSVFASCASPANYSLGLGNHTFQVRATDSVGNTDPTPASYTWIVDGTSPDTTINTNPPAVTTSTSASFDFSSTESGSMFECTLDSSAFTSCTSPQNYSSLAEGSHTFQVRAIDPAGNFDPTPASYTWMINALDTTPPDTTITFSPANPTNSTSASFNFTSTEAASTFECNLDNAGFVACNDPQSYTGLANGSHTFQVRAIDAAGNIDPTPASYTWTIDLVAPDTTITGHPLVLSNSTAASFSFVSSQAGSTFQCSLDGGNFVACSTPRHYTALTNGNHTFEVRARDALGNTDSTPASFSWTIDTASFLGPQLAWAKRAGGTSDDQGVAIAVDVSGNSYVTGFFGSTATFGTGEANETTLTTSANFNIFVAKYNGSGALAWAKQAHGLTRNQAWSIAVDGSGNSYVTGIFEGTATFGLGETNETILTSIGSRDVFIAKYDDSGMLVWVKGVGGTADDRGFGVAVDSLGISLLTGFFQGTVTFGAGEFNETILTSNSGSSDIFVAKYATDGALVWARRAGGSNTDEGLGIAVDASGASYLTGTFAGTATFGLGETNQTVLTSDGNVDIFVAKYDTNGTLLWARRAGGSSGDRGLAIAIDGLGNSFITGSVGGAATFGFGETSQITLNSLGSDDIFLAKYAADGMLVWAKRAGGAAGDQGKGIAVDGFGNSYVTGVFSDTADFGFGEVNETTLVMAGTGGGDTFVAKYDTSGAAVWAKRAGGTTGDNGLGIAVIGTGTTYVAGLFQGAATFALGENNETTLTSSVASTDIFVAKYSEDFQSPDTTITSSPTNPSNSTSATFGFNSTEASSSFVCSLDGGAFTSCTSPTTYNGLADGSHNFQVQATDAAGNTDATPASFSWTIDIVPPETTITSNPPDPSNSVNASFSFTSTEASSTFECSLDGSGFTNCTNPQTYNGLAGGNHNFEVRAIDAAGNFDTTPAIYNWTITTTDITPPETTITGGPAALTNATTASFTFTSNEAGSTFQCRLDAAAFGACTSPRNFTGLAAGTHTFEVRATDAANNTDPSPASFTWVIDRTAPNTTITSGPPTPTNQTNATFTFDATEAGSTFECRVDGAAFASCTSPQNLTGLGAGSHTFRVRAIDPASNVDGSPAVFTWTIDLTAPNTTITGNPGTASSSTSATFTFTANQANSSFACNLDSAGFTSCTTPVTYSNLTEGAHNFQVRATDPAGNSDTTPASFSWTVDTIVPDTTINSTPPLLSNSRAASFSFSSNEAGALFQCSLDGAAFANCSSPRNYTGQADGSHTFQVRARDAAGNIDATPASYTWTIDATDPNTTITSNPPAATNSTSGSFTFTSTEAGSTFDCRLDGAAFASCTSPHNLTGLTAGNHTFRVRAIDLAGNVDGSPAAYSWNVDLTAPNTNITGNPGAVTTSTSATFTFTANQANSTFACNLDNTGFTACTSPATYNGLALGSHNFQVRATDLAGNVDPTPANFNWTIQ